MGTTASLTFGGGEPTGSGAHSRATTGASNVGDHFVADGDPDLLERVIESFIAFDRRFSLYREDSELSAVSRGDLALTAASAQLRNAYASAIGWRNRTGGAFSPHRPDRVIDLNGIVKALAMQAASDLLVASGQRNWCLNVGGDVLCAGTQSPDRPWSVGIVDPFDRSTLICAVVVSPATPAVATSGIAERGDHIWRNAGDRSAPNAREFVQVTVVAESIESADILATAIIAGGPEMLDRATASFAIDAFAVAADGTLRSTPGFSAALAP